MIRIFIHFILLFIMIHLGFCTSETVKNDSYRNKILIHVSCDEFEDSFEFPIYPSEKKDLLAVLADLSIKENPSIRFISTNQTEEIMEINGRRTSWKEGWNIYVNGERISPKELKRGIRIGEKDKIKINLENVERVFGKPTKHE